MMDQEEREASRILNFKRNFTVLWSGGKDSTALLLWILENVKHRDFTILYIEVTGNTHPLCTKYVLDTASKLEILDKLKIVRTLDFFELMDRWGPPLLFGYRWCLYQMKGKYFKEASPPLVDGVRRSDSKVRKKIGLINFSKIANKWCISPILNWRKSQVLDFIKDYGVTLNPCYEIYNHSGNCMFCPYADRKHIIGVMSDPEWRDKILPLLEKHKQKMMKGPIAQSVYRRWTRWANQTVLI